MCSTAPRFRGGSTPYRYASHRCTYNTVNLTLRRHLSHELLRLQRTFLHWANDLSTSASRPRPETHLDSTRLWSIHAPCGQWRRTMP